MALNRPAMQRLLVLLASKRFSLIHTCFVHTFRSRPRQAHFTAGRRAPQTRWFLGGLVLGGSIGLSFKLGQVWSWGNWGESPLSIKVLDSADHDKELVPRASKAKRKADKAGSSGSCNHAFIADAVEKAMASVVNISVETDTSTLLHKKSLISSGSGFFIDDKGSILTNAHVVTDMGPGGTLTITTTDGTQYDGFIHSLDTPSDLAVVKIKPRVTDAPVRWPVLKMSSNMNLRPGDWVVAIGSPFGLHNTVTAGIVSSSRRKNEEIGTGNDIRVEYIQTDCVVHEGSSGGPLINLDGEVVGINTTRAESEGISFAIRVDNAMDIIHQLHTKGRVVRPWLGCRMVTLTSQVRQQIRETGPLTYIPPTSGGVIVTSVFPDSPAAKAGLSDGDVIVAVNGKPVHSSQEVFKSMGLVIHEPISLTVKRSIPLDMDWDGRSRRWETQDVEIKVTPEEFDVELHRDGDGS